MKKQTLEEQISRIKGMMKLNEWIKPNEGDSSYDKFMDNYGEELRNAVKKLNKIDISMLENMDERTSHRLDREMSNYDENIMFRIEQWIQSENVDDYDIAKFAIDNMDRHGTEPQMILYAIDDYCACFGIHDAHDEEQNY
jgi:hypothetical protein